MLSKRLGRFVFYNTERKGKKGYSDSRDVYDYFQMQSKHEDTRYVLSLYWYNFKMQLVTWGLICSGFFYVFSKSRSLRERFEIRYLTQMPVKEYDSSDYDYKDWELVLTRPTEESGQVLTTDIACKNEYVLLYHAEITDSHIAMQRFSRLQKYISMRKQLPVKSVFVGMDKDLDPDLLEDYIKEYSQDIIACYPNDNETREEIGKVFQNIGCVYLLEKSTGNVIYILDPHKHPLETLGTRLLFTISKNEDFRVSKEIVEHSLNVKAGHDEELKLKLPKY